jgi:hypothetical protein
VAGCPQNTRLRMDPECNHGVRILICRQQQRAGRMDGEIARPNALRRLMPHQRQLPGLRVNSVDGDAVVPPVGGIKKTTVGRNLDRGAQVLTREIGR